MNSRLYHGKQQSVIPLDSILREFTHAFRSLRRDKAFACTAALTLALGIGANTAVFSVVRAVLLKPLGYPDADRLAELRFGSTPTRFHLFRSGARTFTAMAAYVVSGKDETLVTNAHAESVNSIRISTGFTNVLAVPPLLGRDFTPAEDSPSGAPVALISSQLWQREFNGDTHVLGKTLTLASGPRTIIGVLPAQLQVAFYGADVWLPRPEDWPGMPAKSRAISPFLRVFGRLKPQATLKQADAEIAVLQHQYAAEHPALFDAESSSQSLLVPLKEAIVGNIRSTLWMLFGAVTLVLLIACSNVAGLLLARSTVRSREFAVRAALGAGRAQIMRQLLSESVLLSVIGGLFGIASAAAAIHFLHRSTTIDLPRTSEIHLNILVLAFAIAVSIITGILFGLAPALDASRVDLMTALRARVDTRIGAGTRFPRLGFGLRGILVISQIALSVVLLIGAALLVQSVITLRGDDPHFNPENLLTFGISLPQSRYNSDDKLRTFFRDLSARLKVIPGVSSVAFGMTVPMAGSAGTPVQHASKPIPKMNKRPIAAVNIITPDYFRTLQIPIKRGRGFTPHDKDNSQRVAVVNESFARRFWPAYPRGLDPIGQFILVGATNPKPAQIIGIVMDIKEDLDRTTWAEGVYLDFEQSPIPNAMAALRVHSHPTSYANAVRKQVELLDREQSISNVLSMDDLMDALVGQRRVVLNLLAIFAGIALLLSVVGIYGLMSYSVSQRTFEIGIRQALGAARSDILWMVIGQVLTLTLIGIAFGVAGALKATKLMGAMLFHVSSTDPATFAFIAALFVAVALAASFIPARRAILIDPMQAFRYE
jgi:predicted permease